MSALRYLCGVPEHQCQGAVTKVSPSWRGSMKSHASSEEAFRCYRRYLLNQGYEQVGPREFKREGEPITVLPKKSRFGSPLRKGKEGRWMPDKKDHAII